MAERVVKELKMLGVQDIGRSWCVVRRRVSTFLSLFPT